MSKCKRYTYYGGLMIDHKTQEKILPNKSRKSLNIKEKKEMKRRETLC